MNKVLPFIFGLLISNVSARAATDLLVVGDSQVGATWSKSYLGNFLQTCLKGNFLIYGRGGTTLGNWLGKGGMDQIQTIQRDPQNPHLNLGSGDSVPLSKKRIEVMLPEHIPTKVLFEFGGNYIGETINKGRIESELNTLKKIIADSKIEPTDCYFLTPTYEMAVATHRNIPNRNLKNVMVLRDIIRNSIQGFCTHIDGLELMKDSTYFDGTELLKRVPIAGKPGCSGAASNDNVHVCGEAAKDFAERVCDRVYTLQR